MHSDRPEMQKSPGGAGGEQSCGADVGIRPYERRREGSVFVEDVPRHGLIEQLLRLVEVAGLA